MNNEIKKINNLSDIEAVVEFKDEDGQPMGIPEFDFEIIYFVKEGVSVSCGRFNGQFTPNISVIGNELHAFFDKPRLGRGVLRTRKTYHIPNQYFPDRERTVVVDGITNTIIE